jgi:hypothetical protein
VPVGVTEVPIRRTLLINLTAASNINSDLRVLSVLYERRIIIFIRAACHEKSPEMVEVR